MNRFEGKVVIVTGSRQDLRQNEDIELAQTEVMTVNCRVLPHQSNGG